MKTDSNVIDADVLIIGGGSAGSMAAIRAKEVDPGQRVVVFEKGDFLYSGCIARGMDALNIVAVPGISTPELYVEANRMSCEGIMDEPPSYRMAQRSWNLLKKLEGWGVCFPTDADGNYEVLKVHPKGRFAVTMKEPELKAILARRAMEAGVHVFNRTMAVEILKEGDRVAGAVGFNVRTGERLVCRCPAVILSAGGTARFGLPNNGYLYGVYDFPGNTGDGYCLGYRAGARMSGFEYTIVYYIIKDINAPLLYITMTRGARLLDPQDKDLPDAHVSIKGMLEEHRKNRGPLRIRMSHMPEEQIAAIEGILFTTERPVMERFFQGRGVNFRSGDIELWPTECYLCGGHGLTGIMVNDKAETAVPGLYAAGDTSLVARGHLSGALAFGQIAAENATAYARSAGKLSVDSNQIQAAFNSRISSLTENGNGPVPIEEFEYKVRRHINDYITPPKNEYKLNRALWWMNRFENEMKSGLVCIKNTHDLFKALEIENIILSARLAATASMERRETRWVPWHFRSDYPEKGGDEWLKHIVLTIGDAPADVKVSFQEIQRIDLPKVSGS